jgi:hypothetical protein
MGLVAAAAGPSDPTFALLSHLLAMAWISCAVAVRQPALTARWFTVRGWEERVRRRVGTGPFRALLRVLGRERVISGQRRFDGTRAGSRSRRARPGSRSSATWSWRRRARPAWSWRDHADHCEATLNRLFSSIRWSYRNLSLSVEM